MTGGVFWGTFGPVTTEVVGLRDLGSALSILWLVVVIPTLLSEPIAVWGLTSPRNSYIKLEGKFSSFLLVLRERRSLRRP